MFRIADAGDLIGARGHRRAAVKDVDVIFERETLIFQHPHRRAPRRMRRSEEHTSELQSLMRISYAVFCLKKKKRITELSVSDRYKSNRNKQDEQYRRSNDIT